MQNINLMMRKTILILSLISIISSCSKEAFNNEVVINGFDKNYKETNSPLTSFIDSIKVIPLKNESNIVLTNPQKIICYKNKFYILDNNRVLCYGPNGNFICLVGERGHGHGEYINIATFVISGNSIKLLDSFKNHIITFTLEGKFISEAKAPEGVLSNVQDAIFENDAVLFMANYIYKDKNDVYTRWNTSTGEVSVVDKVSVKTNETKEFVGKHSFCNYNGNIRYILPFSDVIKSTDNLSIRFPTTRKVLTVSELQNISDFSIKTYAEHLDDFVGFNDIFETSNYILLTFSNLEYTVVDKINNKCFRSSYTFDEKSKSFPLLNILTSTQDTLIGIIDMEHYSSLKNRIHSNGINASDHNNSEYAIILYLAK